MVKKLAYYLSKQKTTINEKYYSFRFQSHRKTFVGIYLDHSPQQLLTLGWHIRGYLEISLFYLLQQLFQIVIVKRQCAN